MSMPMAARRWRLSAQRRVARPTRKRTRNGRGNDAENEGSVTWLCGSGIELEGGESMSIWGGEGGKKEMWMGKEIGIRKLNQLDMA